MGGYLGGAEMTLSFVKLGVPPCWRAYFLLLRQKKVAKEKATPGSAPFGFLALLGRPGGWLNSPAAQTTPAESPRPACVAQRLARGPKASWLNLFDQKLHSHGQPEKKLKNKIHRTSSHAPHQSLPRKRESSPSLDSRLRGNDGTPVSPRVVSPGPLGGAEQRRNAGGLRRGLFEGRSPEFRSRPAFRVAQGTGAAGTDPGSPSSLATFFLAKQEESTPASKAEPQANRNYSPRAQAGRKWAASGAATANRTCCNRRSLSAPNVPLSTSQFEA